MPANIKSIDAIVDTFVKKINSGNHSHLPSNEVPEYLRIDQPDVCGYYNWQILRYDKIDWLDGFIRKLPKRLPPSFLSLISRYTFPAFEIGPISIFANTGTDTYWELSKIFSDTMMYNCLIKNGYLQFGNPSQGNYDPICFDTKRSKNNEYPIVHIDHESVLRGSTIKIIREIAPSFLELIQRV